MAPIQLKGQTAFYRGKVRDVYTIEDKWLVMIASNRISAFDVILPREIPYKGQVLNQIAAYMLSATKDICPNWLIDTPLPNTAIGKKCEPLRVEMVVRGHLTGHALRTYEAGGRNLCGVPLQDGMRPHQAFITPIITPSTKAEAGHDEDISKEEIISSGLVQKKDYEQMEAYSLALFARGQHLARERGLILADTKYEFGKIGDDVVLMDEIHTPDSSRYFYADGFEQKVISGEKPQQLSKEFVREWLIANNFMGKEGQTVPKMTDEWVNEISRRYIELYEKLTGERFVPHESSEESMVTIIESSLAAFNKRKL
jgi:phosphoribosylaminoimidazole-succinocarboxamide synthase